MKIVLVVVISMLAWATGASAQTPANQVADELKIALANQSHLEAEIERSKTALKEAQEELTRQEPLLAEGLIARRTVEQAEAAVRHQQLLLDLLIEQKNIADRAVALAQETAKLAEQQETLKLSRSKVQRVTRSYGRGTWNSRDFEDLGHDFRKQFGRSLPISAYGQTWTHQRLGFNHIHRIDIAVHPDGPEGQWIMDYLREKGIPFVAFRTGVPGHATGPHIHVGLPSSRL
ncbi:MAG: hypothetical protein HY314_06105 [Acidobacteria bacterium]|nr:hypothetical protein [Acidobacteriota bacterium]